MVIILEHGKTYKKLRCEKCNALIGFTEKDIQKFDGENPFGNDWSLREFIKCPECLHSNTIKLIVNGEIILQVAYE